MIPQKPEILKAPLVVDGEKNILPETTPQGSNQFSLLGGFPAITSIPVNAGGLPPKRLDFNAAFNLLSIHTFFLQSGNKYAWDALLDYSIGSTVLGSDNSVYFCIQQNGATPPNTVQDPVSSNGYWIELIKSNGTINIDLITDGAISTQKLANNAITSAKIANSAVTDAKIAGVSAAKVSGLATVAKTGRYNDLINKPNIPANAAPLPTKTYGIGQIFFEYIYDDVTIPSGGSWLTIHAGGNGNGDFYGIDDYTIYAGGTLLKLKNRQSYKQICAWRIQ